MYLTNENLNLIKKNESTFVSLKYLDLQGNLNQIDCLAKSTFEDSNNHGFQVNKNTCLMTIPSKAFDDPFRTLPTTSFLCMNVANDLNTRKYASRLIYGFAINMIAAFEAELKFWITDLAEQEEPFWDIYGDFRSDVLEILDKINIKTTMHRHGKKRGECIIGFKGDDIIDLADNFILVKFVINNVAAKHGQKILFTQGKESNFKLILTCNNNDGEAFYNSFVENNALISEYKDLLQVRELNSKLISKNKLFNDDCKLEIKLLAESIFIPYISLAFIILFFSQQKQILEKLETKEFSRFMMNYRNKVINKKIST